MTTNTQQTVQTMEDGLKPLNLFDAVPFVAQTHFKSQYLEYEEIEVQDIQEGIKEVYRLTSKEYPTINRWNDHTYRVIKRMLNNAVDLIFNSPEQYKEFCEVDAIQLNKDHCIGYNS